jgi:molecular chaperone GrpE (heat shock protein)
MPFVQLLRIDASIDEGGMMSLQAARDFLNQAKDFEAIKKQVNENRSASDIGRDQGYDFTHEELNQALRERNLEPIDEGGISCTNQ